MNGAGIVMLRAMYSIGLLMAAVLSPCTFASQSECGSATKHYRLTWYYTDPSSWHGTKSDPKSAIEKVENVHFNRDVEQLVRGQSAEDPLQDIAYTLTRFPNHHRALWAMSRYWRMPPRNPGWANYGKLAKRENAIARMAAMRGWPPTVACAFDRAIRFSPNDPMVRMLFGMHLHLEGENEKALVQYDKAEALGLNSSEFHYNRGLLHFDMADYEAARKDAEIAYAKGYPLPALREKLAKAGHWQEKEATPEKPAKPASSPTPKPNSK